MSQCLHKTTCPECEGGNFQIFYNEDDTYTGYCFNCSHFAQVDVEGSPKPPPRDEEADREKIEDIATYQCVDVPSRKLSKVDLEAMGCKVSVSETDGKTPTAIYFPMTKDGKVSGYYVKTLGKKPYTFSVGDVRDCDPFNFHAVRSTTSYKLVITEGLADAVAVHSIYRRYGNKGWTPNILSLKNGVNSVKGLAKIIPTISKHKEAILCFDDDEEGRKAVEEAYKIYPHFKSVTLPCKDANDCILDNKGKEAFRAIEFDSMKPKNSRIVYGRDIHNIARKPTEPGVLSWPFETLNKKLRRLRTGETSYGGAGVKMGKSELLDQIAFNIMANDNAPVFIVKPEQNNNESYKRIAGKVASTTFMDPDVPFDAEAYDVAGELLSDKLMMLNLYQTLDWDTLKIDIIHAAGEGAKIAFIDPITNLTNGINSADANTYLQRIAQESAAIALDLDIHIMFFCHLKANDGMIGKDAREKFYEKGEYVDLGNCAHEWGGTIQSNQMTGSRAMMRSCHLMFGLAGNKDPNLDENARKMRWFQILEDRQFGNGGVSVPLFYNTTTTHYREL